MTRIRVRLKLFASLRQRLPAAPRGELDVEVPEGATPADLIERHALPRAEVHLILVNGFYVAPEDAAGHVLADGDEVAMWPPVAGG